MIFPPIFDNYCVFHELLDESKLNVILLSTEYQKFDEFQFYCFFLLYLEQFFLRNQNYNNKK